MISKEDLEKILKAIQESYVEAGKQIKTATMVDMSQATTANATYDNSGPLVLDSITEDGIIQGEVLIDNRNNEEIN